MKNYGSIQEECADKFVKNNDPQSQTTHFSCRKYCPSPALAARFIVRNSIPLILGLVAGVGIKWLNESIDGPEHVIASSKHSTLLEVSDIVSCCATLVIAYGLDRLLNKCWPVNPYHSQQTDFFQTVSTKGGADTIPMDQTGYQATP